MSQALLADEFLPKITEIQEVEVLDRAKQLVSALWGDFPDPTLAMALRVAMMVSPNKGAALATIEAMRRQIVPLAA